MLASKNGFTISYDVMDVFLESNDIILCIAVGHTDQCMLWL